MQYVTTKAVKRIEAYRPRGSSAKAPRKMLLPISFGPSSTCLLAILDSHLQTQRDRMGRTSYELLLAHVDLDTDSSGGSSASVLLEKMKERFPSHSYVSVNIADAVDLDIDWELLGLENYGGLSLSGRDRLSNLFSSVSSATSKADITTILITRLLVDIAKKNNCESILFGDSTTRLAEKTLTETAKGRGFSLPWQVSDGMSPFGITFQYPLRDILKKEVTVFSSLKEAPLTDLIIHSSTSTNVSVSNKSTTIDDLMAQYFESVEENYPSIVANVVRTSSKLKALTASDIPASCGFCGLPVVEGTNGIYGWGGDQNSDSHITISDSQNRGILCYGCSRSMNS